MRNEAIEAQEALRKAARDIEEALDVLSQVEGVRLPIMARYEYFLEESLHNIEFVEEHYRAWLEGLVD